MLFISFFFARSSAILTMLIRSYLTNPKQTWSRVSWKSATRCEVFRSTFLRSFSSPSQPSNQSGCSHSRAAPCTDNNHAHLHSHSNHSHSHLHPVRPHIERPNRAPASSSCDSKGHSHSWFGGHHGHSHGGPLDVEDKSGALHRITVYGAVVNVALAVGKGIAGVIGNSAAMVADAAHSLSDLISDIVTIWVLKEASKPPDLDHPYGHGKFESLGSFALATVLTGTGVAIGLHAMHILQDAHDHLGSAPTSLALGAAVVSVVVKEALYHATVRVGKKHGSSVVVLNAWHHRADGLTSLVAMAGIGGSMMGYPFMDPIAGLLVAGMIVRIGIQSGVDAFRDLTDRQVEGEVQSEIENLLKAEKGVKSFHRLRLRRAGPSVFADVHIVVDPLLSVSSAHLIAERVRLNVTKSMPQVAEFLVHVDVHNDESIEQHLQPEQLGRPATELEADINSIITRYPAILETVRITCDMLSDGKANVLVKVRMDPKLTIESASTTALRLREDLLNEIHDLNQAQVLLDLVHIALARREHEQKKTLQKQQQVQEHLLQQESELMSSTSSTSASKVDL